MTVVKPARRLLAEHYVEDHFVGGFHAGGAEGAEVADSLLDIIVDDAVGGGDAGAAHGEDGGLDGAGHARGHFHRAAHLRSVAHHPGDVPGHILDGGADLLVSPALQPDYSAGGAGGGHDAAAEGGEFSEEGFDVDGD